MKFVDLRVAAISELKVRAIERDMGTQGIHRGEEGLARRMLRLDGLVQPVKGILVRDIIQRRVSLGDPVLTGDEVVKAHGGQVFRKLGVVGLGIDKRSTIAEIVEYGLERNQPVGVLVGKLVSGIQLADQDAIGGEGVVVVVFKEQRPPLQRRKVGHQVTGVLHYALGQPFDEKQHHIRPLGQRFRPDPSATPSR